MNKSLLPLSSQAHEKRLADNFRHRAASAEAPTLFCFSHLRWKFVFQRPQHLLTRAARSYRVFFFEEPVWEDAATPSLRIEPQEYGMIVAVPVLPHEMIDDQEVQEVLRGLVDQLVAGNPASESVHWYYTPLALSFTDHLSADVVIYDCMDELSAFRGASPDLRDCERKLFERADVVFTGGISLYESKRKQHRSVYAFPSSVDAAHFAKAMRPDTVEPPDQAGLAHPRVGFFGVIDERMDLDLVADFAALRPEFQLVFLGPVVKIDLASLPRADNLHWLGSKDYQDLPDYLAGWDVAFMPFAMNESTRFISPTKTPEFLAAGVPVVSTPVADVVRPYGTEKLVEIACTAEEAAAAVDMLLKRPREDWLVKVSQKLADMSWDKTWGEMNKLILTHLHPSSTVSRPRPFAAEVAGRV